MPSLPESDVRAAGRARRLARARRRRVPAAQDRDTDAHERLAHLRGALRLLAAGIEAGTGIVEDMHRAIAAAPLALLAVVPEARVARTLHDGVRERVYASIRGISRLLFRGVDAALEHAGPALAPRAAIPGPLVGVLHGVLGDGLVRDANPLQIAMHLRLGGQRLATTREALAAALPHARARLVVFVHGLACDESCWQHASVRAWGRPGVSYGALLDERHGFTVLHVRYNSGLRISANGRSLSELLRALVLAYPAPLSELVLIGHSMGGLVVRSACHHGRVADEPWTTHVRDVICLGSPHGGAPLEKFGVAAVAALAAVPVTAPIARVLDARSAGIKDLRRGTLVVSDSTDSNAGAAATTEVEAPLPGARYHFLAGSLGTSPLARALGWAIGDGLVRVGSATGAGLPHARSVHLGGLHHMHLLNHPAVFAHIEAALAR